VVLILLFIFIIMYEIDCEKCIDENGLAELAYIMGETEEDMELMIADMGYSIA